MNSNRVTRTHPKMLEFESAARWYSTSVASGSMRRRFYSKSFLDSRGPRLCADGEDTLAGNSFTNGCHVIIAHISDPRVLGTMSHREFIGDSCTIVNSETTSVCFSERTHTYKESVLIFDRVMSHKFLQKCRFRCGNEG